MEVLFIEMADDGRINMQTDIGTFIKVDGRWKKGSFDKADLIANFDDEVPGFFWAEIAREAFDQMGMLAPADPETKTEEQMLIDF